MIQVLDQNHSTAEAPEEIRLLAADVGGTHARVGIVTAHRGDGNTVQVAASHKYVCAEYPGLDAILRDFLQKTGARNITEGAIACAGIQTGGVVFNTNLPWQVAIDEVRRAAGLRKLSVLNDFEAVAHAIPFVDRKGTVLLSGTSAAPANAAVLVAGPGTGFGAAVRVPSDDGDRVLPTEAGQVRFSPGTELEFDILRSLRRERGHVPVEFLLSGPGLVNLYIALAALRGAVIRYDGPAAISYAALRESDPLAVEALETFCGVMGAYVSDLVLLYRALGGVYLAGGILSQIQPFLLQSSFTRRFLDKGGMSEVLRRVPVRLLDHGQLGIVGAASWYVAGMQGGSR